MPPNRFESEVESFLEGSHGDRTHIKRADHHTVTPLCGTLLKPKRRKNRNGYYRSNFVTSQGVGVSVGGTIAHVNCVVKSPEEMFIESEYARLVAKGYISEDE